VGLGPAEIGHHPIAKKLGDLTAVTVYRFGGRSMIFGYEVAPLLRIQPGGYF
jgi:hypothetical protein